MLIRENDDYLCLNKYDKNGSNYVYKCHRL